LPFPPRVNSPTRLQNVQNVPLTVAAEAATPPLAPVAGDYACILSDQVFFYSAANDRRGLFLLPKSYYVRLLEYRSDYCKIEYQTDGGKAQRLIGYARTADLTFVEYVPARPYLYYVFDVSYKIDDAQNTNSSFLTEITMSCVYYGDYLIGSETYCYVLRGEEFGYIPKPHTLSYEENREYADYLASLEAEAQPDAESNASTKTESNSPAQIAILIAICLLVPILAALVMKPPRRPPYESDDE